MNKKIKIIAFYLPQYHPFKENDEWWGKGFTEWTNVGKAKPLFRGHNQPRVPADLGYYDLRLPIVREQQVALAKEAGVTAFCYWHYWFGNGKRLIPEVFQEVLESGSPDFPFCLGWANHSWYSKNWNSDGSISQKILMEQVYPGIEDVKSHFEFLVSAFKDPRYVKVHNKPLLYIFDPLSLPDEYIVYFKTRIVEVGFSGLYLVGNISSPSISKDSLLERGFDAVNYQRLGGLKHSSDNASVALMRLHSLIKRVKGLVINKPPFMYDYSKYYHHLIQPEDYSEDVIPSILPQWDHTPRSGRNGTFFINATPDLFYCHVKDALKAISNKEEPILFLKSWNEWGEGNMMEPDLTYGKGFINALKEALSDF